MLCYFSVGHNPYLTLLIIITHTWHDLTQSHRRDLTFPNLIWTKPNYQDLILTWQGQIIGSWPRHQKKKKKNIHYHNNKRWLTLRMMPCVGSVLATINIVQHTHTSIFSISHTRYYSPRYSFHLQDNTLTHVYITGHKLIRHNIQTEHTQITIVWTTPTSIHISWSKQNKTP